MPSYLSDIVATHRARAAADGRSLDAAIERAKAVDAPRDFAGALRQATAPAVIAEIKRRSPSKGDLAPGLVPSVLAKSYVAGGATCLSVLTDATYFGGSAEDLRDARHAVQLPVLRKDFTVSVLDVADAREMGADAVLLIVAALDDTELRDFAELAEELGMTALVEVHDQAELDRALAAGASVVGINQRDLRTFDVDRERAEKLAAAIPRGVTSVAESGIRNAADLARLREVGFDAVLVGETLVTASDPAAALAALRGEAAPCS